MANVAPEVMFSRSPLVPPIGSPPSIKIGTVADEVTSKVSDPSRPSTVIASKLVAVSTPCRAALPESTIVTAPAPTVNVSPSVVPRTVSRSLPADPPLIVKSPTLVSVNIVFWPARVRTPEFGPVVSNVMSSSLAVPVTVTDCIATSDNVTCSTPLKLTAPRPASVMVRKPRSIVTALLVFVPLKVIVSLAVGSPALTLNVMLAAGVTVMSSSPSPVFSVTELVVEASAKFAKVKAWLLEVIAVLVTVILSFSVVPYITTASVLGSVVEPVSVTVPCTFV